MTKRRDIDALTEYDTRLIIEYYSRHLFTQVELAEMFGTGQPFISYLLKKYYWSKKKRQGEKRRWWKNPEEAYINMKVARLSKVEPEHRLEIAQQAVAVRWKKDREMIQRRYGNDT